MSELTAGKSSVVMLEPTLNLRIVRPMPDFSQLGSPADRLQQLWVCKITGKQEWRDVEMVGILAEKLQPRKIVSADAEWVAPGGDMK